MQIRVEIEVKPEELRRFLGLPDVAGLQDDVVDFLKEKVGQASEGLSPAADFVRENLGSLKHKVGEKVGQASEGLSPAADFVRENLGSLKDSGSATLAKLLSSVKLRLGDSDEPQPVVPPPPPAGKRRRAAATAPTAPARRRAGTKKPSGA